jgi:Spy/CpxP family protein refolding chaperone
MRDPLALDPGAQRMHAGHGLGVAALLALASAGCGSRPSQATAPVGMALKSETAPAATHADDADDADESTADLREHHRHHSHGGFAMFIAMSLDSLGAPAGSGPNSGILDQRAGIATIQAEMRAKMGPAHDAEKNVLMTLADGIAAGTIDTARVNAALAHLSEVAARVNDTVADSLDALHAILTRPQRAALVEKVEAHFEVWNEVNAADESDRDARGGHLGELSRELDLSPEQVDTVRASLKSKAGNTPPVPWDRKEGEEYLRAFGAAFEGDALHAKTLPTASAVNAHLAAWGATRTVLFYEAVASVLTPEERTKLVTLIRRHANYHQTQTGP